MHPNVLIRKLGRPSIGDIGGVIYSGWEKCGRGNEISVSRSIDHNVGPSNRKMRIN